MGNPTNWHQQIHSLFFVGNGLKLLTRPKYAWAYFTHYKVNLLNGFSSHSSQNELITVLKKIKINSGQNRRVLHLYYELGKLLQEFNIGEELLCIDIEYEQERFLPLFRPTELIFKLVRSVPFNLYREVFNRGMKHLRDGDCYQINLTFPFHFSFSKTKSPLDFYKAFFSEGKGISPYAHATYLPIWEKLYLSNSPECLIQKASDQKLYSMPIKGTVKRSGNDIDDWRSLSQCRKNAGELNMITDLVRNDLSGIGEYFSRVIEKKSPLPIHGLLHQYSLMVVKIKKEQNLYSILRMIFPGGSVTGAPKRRVMQIIAELERERRGAYTGSTCLFLNGQFSSSINIRTMDIDLKNGSVLYSAGGGITLLSECEQEFDEMWAKVESVVPFIKEVMGHVYE